MMVWDFFVLLSSNVYNTGQFFGKIFWIVILLAGIAKCITISRRQTTSSPCVHGLTLNLLAWLICTSFYLFTSSGMKSPILAIIICIIVILLAFVGACLAIYGFADYFSHPEYVQGRKQAVAAIVICIFVIGSIVLGFVMGYKSQDRIPASMRQDTSENGVLKYEKYNFQYRLLGKPWVEIKPAKFNRDAAFVLMRTQPQMTFMIIPEKITGTPDPGLETVVEVSKANLKSAANNVKITDEVSHSVKGMNGIRFYSEAEIGSYKYAYVHWIYKNAGCYYQLITCGDLKDVKHVRKEAEILASHFELIKKLKETDARRQLSKTEKAEKYTIHNKTLEFKDLNFKFTYPGKPWVPVDAKKFNRDAAMALMCIKPQIIIMVIAEKGGEGPGVNTGWLAEVSKVNLKSNSKTCNIIKEDKYTINGIEGIRFFSDAELGNKMKFSYVHWVTVHNGYYYQLVIFGGQKDRAQVDQASEKLFKGFSLIDPKKVVKVEKIPFETFKSDVFGYTIDLKNTDWQKWPDIKKESPIADTGGLIGDRVCFIVIPFLYKNEKVPLDAVINIMLLNLNTPNPSAQIKVINNIRENHMPGLICGHEKKIGGKVFDYRIKIIRNNACAYMIMVWALKDDPELGPMSEQVFKSVRFMDPNQIKDDLASLSSHQKINLAIQYNNVGLFYFSGKQYEKSIECFQKAECLDKTNGIYRKNINEAKTKLNEIKRKEVLKQAQEKRKEMQKQIEEKRKARQLQLKQQQELINTLAPEVFKGKFKTAFKKYKSFEYWDNFPDIQKILKDAANADKSIIKSFKDDIGKSIFIKINKKPQAVKIKKLKGSKIYYETAVGKAKIVKYFRLKQLDIKEKKQRLGDETNDIAKALYLGSEAVKDNQYYPAKDYFSKSGLFKYSLLKLLTSWKESKLQTKKK